MNAWQQLVSKVCQAAAAGLLPMPYNGVPAKEKASEAPTRR